MVARHLLLADAGVQVDDYCEPTRLSIGIDFGLSFHVFIETKEDVFVNLALGHAGNQFLHKLIEVRGPGVK